MASNQQKVCIQGKIIFFLITMCVQAKTSDCSLAGGRADLPIKKLLRYIKTI